MAEWKLSMDRVFLEDLNKVDSSQRKQIMDKVNFMARGPFESNLDWEKLSRIEPGLYSTRVNDTYRIIWKHIKPNEILIFLVDQHEAAYQRARRIRVAKESNQIKVVDVLKSDASSTDGSFDIFTPQIHRYKNVGNLFIRFTDAEIRSWGVPEEYFANIRALDDSNQLLEFEERLPKPVFNQLLEVLTAVIDRQVVPDEQIVESLIENQGGENIIRFENSEEFNRALAGGMEDWMLFLAPEQKAIVRHQFNGPARIKGIAGSGKTMIAIHRAKYLAEKASLIDKKVLFLTYGNRLPNIINYLLEQLLGEGNPLLERIECRTILSWCGKFLRENDVQLNIDTSGYGRALFDAIREESKTVASIKVLPRLTEKFIKEEIEHSIKGKMLETKEEYLALERSGRGTRLAEGDRECIWQIYENYQNNLNARKINDYEDLTNLAYQLVKDGKQAGNYCSVIVDEIQDLTEANMKLVRAIVPKGENDIFLVGDGLQKIYPGGYSLNKAGIDISGRGRLLRKNYRNTQQIMQAAQAMMEGVQYEEVDDEIEDDEIPELSVRQGKLPILGQFSREDYELEWVQGEIDRLIQDGLYTEKDIAILTRWKANWGYVEELINEKKHLIVEIDNTAESYFGPGVKLTTFHSAKSLEFKVVFLVGLQDGYQVRSGNASLPGEIQEEYLATEKRLLYVAMTRARDLLYLTYWGEKPSSFLDGIPEEMIQRISPDVKERDVHDLWESIRSFLQQ